MKRKIDLLQAALNRMESVSLSTIEHALDEEFAEWQRKMTDLAVKIKGAKRYSDLPTLSTEDATEVQQLFRMLAKRLHPDINSNQDESVKNLWMT